MELQDLVSGYVTKLNTLVSLIDLQPALLDEDDTLIAEYGTLAKTSVLLSDMLRKYKEEVERSKEITSELQVYHWLRNRFA